MNSPQTCKEKLCRTWVGGCFLKWPARCQFVILGGWDQEDLGSRPQDPLSKITRAKMDRRCGSSSRVPALQIRSPEFKPQFHKKKGRRHVVSWMMAPHICSRPNPQNLWRSLIWQRELCGCFCIKGFEVMIPDYPGGLHRITKAFINKRMGWEAGNRASQNMLSVSFADG
jgi:hypothetical protein